jgi:arsenite-transporting ATPase
MLRVIEDPTRFVFFTGKGGVGKTSLATATAVGLADRGKRILLVSTDPASNLGQVLEHDIGEEIAPVGAVRGLSAVDIDPEAAAGAYRERVVGPVRDALPAAVVGQIEEQLSGACTTEIAAFDEFTKLLTDASVLREFDHIIFDTAPTGHTLRLLQLPAAWASFIEENPGGSSCLGPLSGLEARREQYAEAVRSLRDPALTSLVLVSRPEQSALAEALRTGEELSALGIGNQQLLINGVFEAQDRTDPLAQALEKECLATLSAIPDGLLEMPRETVALRAYNLVGVPALRRLLSDERLEAASGPEAPEPVQDRTGALGELVDEIADAGHGLLLVMGKGGVGKTTIAAAVAAELAHRGVRVHLSTTDPAAHVAQALSADVGGLTVSRIDPRDETRRYVERVLATRGKDLDDAGRRLLEEDLRSPCTEEVAVFQAFARIVNEARRGVVVLDTAPTGHTLLLLDATGAYHREVVRNSTMAAEQITTPMMRLRDPDYTRIVVVTLAETTPVLEAAGLQDDLRRAGIEPFAWIINRSLTAAQTADPLLRARAAAEVPLIQRVQTDLAKRTLLVPMQADPPTGVERLRRLVGPGAVPSERAQAQGASASRGTMAGDFNTAGVGIQ